MEITYPSQASVAAWAGSVADLRRLVHTIEDCFAPEKQLERAELDKMIAVYRSSNGSTEVVDQIIASREKDYLDRWTPRLTMRDRRSGEEVRGTLDELEAAVDPADISYVFVVMPADLTGKYGRIIAQWSTQYGFVAKVEGRTQLWADSTRSVIVKEAERERSPWHWTKTANWRQTAAGVVVAWALYGLAWAVARLVIPADSAIPAWVAVLPVLVFAPLILAVAPWMNVILPRFQLLAPNETRRGSGWLKGVATFIAGTAVTIVLSKVFKL